MAQADEARRRLNGEARCSRRRSRRMACFRGNRVCAPHRHLHHAGGRLTGQRQRLLEQQRSTSLDSTHGQRTLNVRGNGKGDGVDRADQSVDVGEGLRTVLSGKRRALRRIPTPDTYQFCPGMSRDSRGVHGRGPEAGADQAKAQHSREPTPESVRSPTPFRAGSREDGTGRIGHPATSQLRTKQRASRYQLLDLVTALSSLPAAVR